MVNSSQLTKDVALSPVEAVVPRVLPPGSPGRSGLRHRQEDPPGDIPAEDLYCPIKYDYPTHPVEIFFRGTSVDPMRRYEREALVKWLTTAANPCAPLRRDVPLHGPVELRPDLARQQLCLARLPAEEQPIDKSYPASNIVEVPTRKAHRNRILWDRFREVALDPGATAGVALLLAPHIGIWSMLSEWGAFKYAMLGNGVVAAMALIGSDVLRARGHITASSHIADLGSILALYPMVYSIQRVRYVSSRYGVGGSFLAFTSLMGAGIALHTVGLTNTDFPVCFAGLCCGFDVLWSAAWGTAFLTGGIAWRIGNQLQSWWQLPPLLPV